MTGVQTCALPIYAERIDVGAAAPEPRDQDAICYLLAEKAREGKVVARLKWGDPFLFDRGSEEALFLHEQGVRYEVVPGIPQGVAASAYAGIPISYRGAGDTVTFVRGHEDEGREKARIDWTSLAKLDGTIVSFAGPHQLPRMLHALIEHGRDPEDPAAVVLKGTLPSQRTVTGTLPAAVAGLSNTLPSMMRSTVTSERNAAWAMVSSSRLRPMKTLPSRSANGA